MQKLRVGPCQLTNGCNAVLVQLVSRMRTYIQKIGNRQRINQIPAIIPVKNRDGIRLLVITPELGINLVPRDTHTDGNSQLLLDSLTDFLRDASHSTDSVFRLPRSSSCP